MTSFTFSKIATPKTPLFQKIRESDTKNDFFYLFKNSDTKKRLFLIFQKIEVAF